MTTFIALLRAVNVGGTGKLPMRELQALCAAAGFERVETYIASGNVVFDADGTAAHVQAALESRLRRFAGKPIGVHLRSAAELGAVLSGNPFTTQDPRRTYVFFLATKPPRDAISDVRGQTNEDIRPGVRELYVHYPQGMGQSKLVLRTAADGTARNMNTVAKLAAMSVRTPR